MTGLVKKRPGPKSAHKLTADILAFIEEKTRRRKTAWCPETGAIDKRKIWQRGSPENYRTCSDAKKKKEKMTLRYSPTGIESDDSAVLQYESLRSQVLNRQEHFFRTKFGSGTVYTPRDAGLDRGLPPIHTSTLNQGKAAAIPQSLRMKQHRK